MSVTAVVSRKALPENVRNMLQYANAYYSAEYEGYVYAEQSEPVYVYNEYLIQIVSVHTIKGIFKTASFLSEPFWLTEEQSDSQLQKFLDEVCDVLKKQIKVDWVCVTPAGSLFMAYPTHAERIRFGNHVIDLRQEEDLLLAGMESKHRNMVRRGERGGVEVKFGGVELLEDYILLDKQTWERSGQTIDHTAFYKKYIEALTPNVVVAVAYKDDVPQCGLIGLFNKQMFYYMFGASAHRPEPGATHYMQWQTILRMKQMGVASYNFVGCRLNEDKDSKYHNIQHFKKGFGGTLQECFMFRITLKKTKKWLFDGMMRLRTGKKPQDVIDQEIHKWEQINSPG